MFDPVGFYRLASKLLERKPSEAAARTAASRAYYASFLKARSYTGLDHLRGPEVHRSVIVELHRVKRSDLATRLQELRVIRNEADYDTTRIFTNPEARMAVSAASSILGEISRK